MRPRRGDFSGAKHELDLNDPRAAAAISEAMDNPISELIAVWNQLNLQHFLYYAPTPEWEIGMSPNAFVNWNAPSGNQVTFPLGVGVHHLFSIGKLPVSMGIEGGYSVIHPDDLPGSRWYLRFTLTPLLPAPWSHLAKELRALQ